MSDTNVMPGTPGKLSKQTIFNYALLFSMVKSAVTRTLNNNTTTKTDKIIQNSLQKAIDKHMEDK